MSISLSWWQHVFKSHHFLLYFILWVYKIPKSSYFNTGFGQYSDLVVAKSLQSCPTLCDPIDSSPPGSPVPGILQARTLEWVAISFSNEWKWKVTVKSLSRVWLLATPWTAAYQAPLSMGFSRQEYRRGAIASDLVARVKWTASIFVSNYKKRACL